MSCCGYNFITNWNLFIFFSLVLGFCWIEFEIVKWQTFAGRERFIDGYVLFIYLKWWWNIKANRRKCLIFIYFLGNDNDKCCTQIWLEKFLKSSLPELFSIKMKIKNSSFFFLQKINSNLEICWQENIYL